MLTKINSIICIKLLILEYHIKGIDKLEKKNVIVQMKKLIDIPDEIVKPLKIMAVHKDRDLKNYIQDVLVNHVNNKN